VKQIVKTSQGRAALYAIPADALFLIKGGRVKLVNFFEDGSELTLDIRKDGDVVGENSFSNQGLYPVSAICLEETLTCGFNRNQFEQLILKHPNIGLQVIKNLSDRITWAMKALKQTGKIIFEDKRLILTALSL